MTHLQLEALLTVAWGSADPFDIALVCLLGLLGLRIFDACGANIGDLGEEHGRRPADDLGHRRRRLDRR
ncbi:MAG TPA: hypothetical protein VGJ95_18045 [Pseudonocardiaceae bacterium]